MIDFVLKRTRLEPFRREDYLGPLRRDTLNHNRGRSGDVGGEVRHAHATLAPDLPSFGGHDDGVDHDDEAVARSRLWVTRDINGYHPVGNSDLRSGETDARGRGPHRLDEIVDEGLVQAAVHLARSLLQDALGQTEYRPDAHRLQQIRVEGANGHIHAELPLKGLECPFDGGRISHLHLEHERVHGVVFGSRYP